MIFLLLAHAVSTLVGTGLVFLFAGRLEAISFGAGAAVAFLNLSVLVMAWPRILAKKLVALSVGVIVFKFAILAWILNEVATGNYLNLGWFAVGLALVVPSVLLTAFKVSSPSVS